MILGVDEVGRGPWAGPLVVGAVVLGDIQVDGLTDSKKLSAKRRKELSLEIHDKAEAVGLGWVEASELDEIGMSQSLVEATKRAVAQIKVPYHEIIIDGTINFLADTGKGQYVTTLKKADLLIASVSAASIVAKVARDEYMTEQSEAYPEYGFESHSGYGTAKHRAAIDEHGITPLHRLSFAPLAKYRQTTPDAFTLASHKTTGFHPAKKKSQMPTSKSIGDRAESVAAAYLESIGHTVVERNWKTKYCEIDIVSQKGEVIYFTEVKYRKNNKAGGGMAAITAKKLRQMKFAAELFALNRKLKDVDLRLSVIEVSGESFEVTEYLERV